MKKILIVYASVHHKNTEKVINYLSEKINADKVDITKNKEFDTSAYDKLILASGIYYGSIHKALSNFISLKTVEKKKVILVYTCGMRYRNYAKSTKELLIQNGAEYLGDTYCKGFDTFGPLQKIGGIGKGHPSEKDLKKITEKVVKMIQ